MDVQSRKQYPSEVFTEDPKRLETQIRVFKRWLNSLLKQANAREVTDILDIFRDTKNLYFLCKHLAGQKLMTCKETTSEDASYLDRAVYLVERLYGTEIATVIQTAVVEISSKQSWDTEGQLQENQLESNSIFHNLLNLALDAIWIFIVAVRAGTGPPSNLVGSISSSGSTITRRSWTGVSSGQTQSPCLTSVRTPCLDRWLIGQDERLMAWCIAVTEGYNGLNICNFTHSWRDGLAFLAIAHQSRPDLFTYETRLEKTVNQNLSLAFHLATAEFATPRLLEPMDMHPESVDARATAAYVMEFRKAVERDRKRRSRGILEIQTSAMAQDHTEGNPDGTNINVTVLSRSSPTSSVRSSETTWLDEEEFEDDSGDESGRSGLPDPELFDTMIETTLAWLLAMEERFANNDLTKYDNASQSGEQFHWTDYCKTDVKKNLQSFNHLSTEERNEVELLTTLTAERLKKLHEKILARVDEAMAHFEVHEDLTAHLSRRQMSVGRCLRLGSRIIQACRDRSQLSAFTEDNAGTTNDLDREDQTRIRQKLMEMDPEVIQRQTALLATRWNNLCRVNQTMGRRITTCLLRRQGMLLIAIRLQLEKLEAEKARQAEIPLGPSIRELKSQLEVNRSLEEGIEIGEVLAERLDNFITLVPLRGAEDSTEKETGLESIIAELATRWSHLVDWVNTRYAKLQNALLHWRHFEEEASVLSDWLTERAEEVGRVSAMASASHNKTVAARQGPTDHELNLATSIKSLERAGSARMGMRDADSDRSTPPGEQSATNESVQRLLDENEAEMEAVDACLAVHESRWAQLLASLDRRAQALREACGDTEEVSRLVEATVDQLVSRWSQLAEPQLSTDEWIDRYTKDMDQYLESGRPEEFTAEITTGQKEKGPSDNKRAAGEQLAIPKSSKVPCLDTPPPASPTGYRAEFESKAEELLNWLENSAEALELITMEKNRALEATSQAQAVGRKVSTQIGMDAEAAIDVTNRVAKEAVEWKEIMNRVLTMGERYHEELRQAGENVEELDQLFDEVEERWNYLNTLLTEAKRQVRVANRSAEFQLEAAKIQELLTKSQEADPETTAMEIVPECVGKNDAPPPIVITSPMDSPPKDYTEDIADQLKRRMEQLGNQLAKVEEVVSGTVAFSSPDDLDDQLTNAKNLIKDLHDEDDRFTAMIRKPRDTRKNPKLEERIKETRYQLEKHCEKLKNRLRLLQDLNDQLEFFMNQFEGIEKWLSDMRDYLDSVSQAHLPSTTVIRAQLQESCEALKDMETLEPTLLKVDDVAKYLANYCTPSYKQILNERLDALRANWAQVRELTKSNRDQLEQRLAEKLSAQSSADSADAAVDSHRRSIEEVRTPQSTSLPDMTTVLGAPREMIQSLEAGGPFANDGIGITGAAAAAAASSGSHGLHGSVGNEPPMLRVDLEQLENWMAEAKRQLSAFAVIETQSDLKRLEQTIQSLSDEIAQRRYILAALDTQVAVSMMDQPISETESLLTRAHFADLESAVAAERERVRAALYHLEDFKTVLDGERRWFDAVAEVITRIKAGEHEDFADLSDDLESLDRVASEHVTEDEERLKSLANSLAVSKVLAASVKDQLEEYKNKLITTQSEIVDIKKKYQSVSSRCRAAEVRATEMINWLTTIEPQLRDRVAAGISALEEPEKFSEWQKQINEVETFIENLEMQIKEAKEQAVGALLVQKLEMIRNRLQESVFVTKQMIVRLSQPSDFEPRLAKVRREVAAIEKQTCLLHISSIDPEHIQTNTEKAKELLTRLNEIRPGIDYVQQTGQTLVENKAVEFPDRLLTELSSLTDRHKKLVMAVLLALERLEDALPLAQRLHQSMTNLNQQLASVEEVTDYLENADCPRSRHDMLQRVYTSLEELCGKEGVVEQIRETMAKMKPLMQMSTNSLDEAFGEIERRLERVVTTKQAFRVQLEQMDQATEDAGLYESNVTVQAAKSPSERQTFMGSRPSVNETIELLISPDTPVSPAVRELAREIRDHLRSTVLFNRFCLGTNAPIPTTSYGSETEGKSHLLENNQYETTIAERKAIVKHFRQQRVYLGDRLRELIVNAGGGDSEDRLQDLLSLQSVWHETSDKLDRRGEHMALLEQQLTTADQAITNFMKNPTVSQSAHCVKLLDQLEKTYGWKLTADHERIRHRMSGKPSTAILAEPAVIEESWPFNEDLIGKYEHKLKTVSRYLNEIQMDLDSCKCGPLNELKSILKRLEVRFIDSYQLLSEAAETLNELTADTSESRTIHKGDSDGRMNKANKINPDELVWLKVLLDTQKSRIDIYSMEFRANREEWESRADQWNAFCAQMDLLKSLISKTAAMDKELDGKESKEFRGQLQKACYQFTQTNKLGMDLIQTDTRKYGRTIADTSATSVALKSDMSEIDHHLTPNLDASNPPAVPPRKNSLHRGRSLISGEHDRDSIAAELNEVRTRLYELCKRHHCLEWITGNKDSESNMEPGTQINPGAYMGSGITKRSGQTSSYVNVDWSDDGVPPIPLSVLDEFGNYKNDVEACLRGLAEENRWFVQESGLVPAGLFKRKSDDILLSSAPNRTKPTTPSELRLDNRFWLDSAASDKELHSPIEFTPSWLKSKWAQLENLIEVTFDHEKHSNNWCRKATQLVKIFRERDGQRSSGASETRVLNRLESECGNLREALNHAQLALKRRKNCLTQWQANLVELDTLLAEIKTMMGSFEMTGNGVRGETPNLWLADLHRHLTESPRDGMGTITKDQWIAELSPRNSGLGSYLDTLAESWTRIQESLTGSEQAPIVRVPEHIASQVGSLVEEWDKLKKSLNLKSLKGWSVRDAERKRELASKAAPSGITATVICAPSTWPAHTTSAVASTAPSSVRPTVTCTSATLNQTTSPTLARIRNEIDQLSRWLTSVSNFTEMSRVRLGDRFDQETVNRQLQQAKLATSEGSQMNLQQVFHPAALQLKIQQFLTELEARKPQLDRISVEKERLVTWDSDELINGDLSSQAEHLPQLWTTAEKQMTQRSAELETVIGETQRLKDLEREVDRWINKAESELDAIDSECEANAEGGLQSHRRFSFVSDTNRKKRLQDLTENLSGRAKQQWDQYRKEAASLIERFISEDTSKLQSDVDDLTKRWQRLQERLKHVNLLAAQQQDNRFESPVADADRIVLTKSRRTPSLERSARGRLVERLDQIERKVNQIGLTEFDFQRQISTGNENPPNVEYRSQVASELQILQNELNSLSSQMTGSSRPSNQALDSTPDDDLVARWQQLRDKVASLRQSMQTTSSQYSLFLARLKQLNSWVSHRDAAFRAIICPLHGDLLFIMKMRELMLNLFRELETQRTQVEDALQQGRLQYGEERAVDTTNLESEVESDSSELGLRTSLSKTDGEVQGHVVTSAPVDEQSKRIIRRIRRYLFHLKKRWLTLNSNMLDYKQQLDSISERLANFQSLFNDAVEQVRSAHSVTLRWTPVDCIDPDRYGPELGQAQSFHEACEPLTVLLNNLDRQLLQFQDSAVTIDPGVIAQQSALRNDFEQVRLLTEARIGALNQALASLQSQPQTLNRTLSHRTVAGTVQTPTHDGTHTAATMSPPTIEPVVPLHDSVSPPWERCVHPSGTQVPYYKNHSTQETQWDHPILAELMQSMKQLNGIRFAEYRTAMKLRRLQKTLCLDALSISIIVDSLKHIGHSQPIEGPHTDPFDRTINVPQIIDCLLQLYNRANAAYDQVIADDKAQPKRAEFGELGPQSGFDDPLNPGYSPRKTPPNTKWSTLPTGAKPSDIRDHESPNNRGSITKCGRGFRRSASAQRASRRTGHSGQNAGSEAIHTRPTSGCDLPLTEGNRSASLPESVQLAATANQFRSSSRRGSGKIKRGYPTGPTKHPVNVCVDLTLNWLLNVYDRMRKGNIRALSFKVALTILSVANLDDKYRYLFSLIMDSNGCVTEQRLSALLYECILIPRNLGEGGWIGKEDFTTTVKLCFSQVLEIARGSDRFQNNSPYRGQSIPLRHFLTWLRFGPQTIMWLPLLHRVMIAEQMVHPVRCGVCQTHPVVGLRYRCLRCLNFDLCQQCFFSGRTARSHKLTHPMQEYCSNSTSSDSFRDFTRIVRNRFRSRDRLQQVSNSQSVLGRPNLHSVGLTRGRSRCCEPIPFSEDKPRPAPKFGSDLASLLPHDSTVESPSGRGRLSKGNSFESTDPSVTQSQTPNVVTEPFISRPMSIQLTNSPEYRPPPRAASDTRQLRTAYKDTTAISDIYRMPHQASRISEPIADDEHHLIAKYSQELRQQSEPELIPGQMKHPTHVPATPGIMDRSTISDGLPTLASPLGMEPHTGHLSLDRRHLGRGPALHSLPYNGYSASHTDSNATYGRVGGFDSTPTVRPDLQNVYRQTPQPGCYPMASNPSLPKDPGFDPYGAHIQRSYSLRARSQPPPEVHLQASRQTPNMPMDLRTQWYPSAIGSHPGYPQSAMQTINSLEEERRALQSEYERLRQRDLTPSTPYTNASRIQTQQAQQRFARMQLQHQLMQQQQQQQQQEQLMRANIHRGYGQRFALQRPPSAGPPYTALPNITTGTGRFNYGGSLGRANSVTNGFNYLADIYGSEPRVSAQYGPENLGLVSTEFPANAIGGSSEIVATEARLLREHKGRLEVRMQQLEDHNRQLEQQLQRLRQYLVTGAACTTPTSTMGLAGAPKTSTELLSDRSTLDPKIALRQRSASGGLSGQYDNREGKSFTASGSVGQLAGPDGKPAAPVAPKTRDGAYRSQSDTVQQSASARSNQHEYYQPNSDEFINGAETPRERGNSADQRAFSGIIHPSSSRCN